MGKKVSLGAQRSATEPPATERKAEPAKPVRKRKMKKTGLLLANATGKPRRKKARKAAK